MSEGVTIAVNFEDASSVIPRLGELVAKLDDRTGLNEAVGRRCLNLTRDYLTQIAQDRHATADRLGASPTGHWAQAAEKTFATHDGEGATITINQPGIGRAMHDVDIEPTHGKFLTIPNKAEAYGQRAYRMDLKAVFGKDGPWALVPRDFNVATDAADWAEQIKAHALYLLVTHVHQRQDRTLLPSNEQYVGAALQGARDYVGYLLHRQESEAA